MLVLMIFRDDITESLRALEGCEFHLITQCFCNS
jgi:hypothetical protein